MLFSSRKMQIHLVKDDMLRTGIGKAHLAKLNLNRLGKQHEEKQRQDRND
jgi:hypothetical protein